MHNTPASPPLSGSNAAADHVSRPSARWYGHGLMEMINRSALLLLPKQPMLDWVNGHDESKLTLDILRDEPRVYLLPPWESQADLAEILAIHHEEILVELFQSWFTDDYPRPALSIELMGEWFDVSVHSMVHDVAPGKIKRMRW